MKRPKRLDRPGDKPPRKVATVAGRKPLPASVRGLNCTVNVGRPK